jgi:hypothetical protein
MSAWENSIIAVCATAISAVATICAVIVTYYLTKKKERDSEWRKLKFGQYQEFILALSGVVRERATREGQRRYADAVNSMSIVATPEILSALMNFQREISYKNSQRTQQKHDDLLDALIRLMREDIYPGQSKTAPDFSFYLLGMPPESE